MVRVAQRLVATSKQKSRKRLALAFCGMSSTVIFLPYTALAINIDCNNTNSFLEDAICSDKRLAQLIDKFVAEYERTMKEAANPNLVHDDQTHFFDAVEKCQDAPCIERLFTQQLEELKK